MDKNINKIIQRRIESRIAPVREKLAGLNNYVKKEVYQEWDRTPFSCDKCNKDIEKDIVIIERFRDMDQWYNHAIGESFNVYHSKCFYKNNLEEQRKSVND